MARSTFGGPRPTLPPGLQRLLNGVLVVSVVLNAWLLLDRRGEAERTAVAATVPEESVNAVHLAPPEPVAPPAPAPVDTPAPALVSAGGFDGLQRIDAPIEGSLASVYASRAEGRQADWLTMTTNRLLVWTLDPRSDLRKGDHLSLLFDPIEGGQEGEVRIAAMRLAASKFGRELRGYYFQKQGARFGDWYDEKGQSVAARLRNGPIREYQQITSLLKDGRRHKGMDFTAPVGTEIAAPFDGTVTRVNWNWKANGNCVELKLKDGVYAKFLHLDAVRPEVQAGRAVRAGQVIAASGNTGRSNAPHLHYQLNRGPDGAIIDPIEYHGTTRDQLAGADLERYRGIVAELDAALAGKAAPAAGVAAVAGGTAGAR